MERALFPSLEGLGVGLKVSKMGKSISYKIGLVLVISQFFCTSMWFAGNAVVGNLYKQDRWFNVSDHNIPFILSNCVLFGFILGTLTFALKGYSDKYSPSKVFAVNALIAALVNVLTPIAGDISLVLFLRFATGFFLAGIYPVGMKIASDHFGKDIGKVLGYLLGALALGSASPLLIRYLFGSIDASIVFIVTSSLAFIGGVLVYFEIPDGPFRSNTRTFKFSSIAVCFRDSKFKAAALGYFGHMWELYAFWTVVPLIWETFNESGNVEPVNVNLMSFIVIAIGAIGCVLSTRLASKCGFSKMAIVVLSLSGICCLMSPFILDTGSFQLLFIFLIFWGFTVIADSPLFSSMVAMYAEPSVKGSALTIVNCIGFSITVIAIEVLKQFIGVFDLKYGLIILAPGPILGVWALVKEKT